MNASVPDRIDDKAPGRGWLAVAAFATLLTAILIGLAVTGAVQNYSPVPYWDMWDGYLDFFLRVQRGEWIAWWSPHNEHRIVLSRMLFWFDLRYLQGSAAALIAVNYGLAACTAALFVRLVKRDQLPHVDAMDRYLLGCLLVSWLFCWTQKENLTWGFQSQFFVAQLLPLAALHLLADSSPAAAPDRRFAGACCLGLLSVGAMANGVLALPVMLVHQLVLRARPVRLVLLAGLSVLELLAYFHGQPASSTHSGLRELLTQRPLEFVDYIVSYLGGPWFHLLHGRSTARLVGRIAGAILLGLFLLLVTRELRPGNRDPRRLALIGFLGYIVTTAAVTAVGRLAFGVDQALAGRYTTPTLMAWAVLLLLFAPMVLAARWRPLTAAVVVLAQLLLLGPTQWTALRPAPEGFLWKRELAALAVSLGVHDAAAISEIYPSATRALQVGAPVVRAGLAIFGTEPLRDLQGSIGAIRRDAPAPSCMGAIDDGVSVPDEQRFVLISGWLRAADQGEARQVVAVSDPSGRIVGYVLSGLARPDVAAALGPQALHAGFRGYVLREAMGSNLTLHHRTSPCALTGATHVPLFSAESQPLGAELVTVSPAALTGANQWLGQDWQKSQAPGVSVLGSFIRSDRDTGQVTLRLHPRDRLFFRSGPVNRRQRIRLDDGVSLEMPSCADWTLLTFEGLRDADGSGVVVTFSDEGTDWGEWSAIAIRAGP